MSISDGAVTVLKEFVGDQPATGAFADEVAGKYKLEDNPERAQAIARSFIVAAEAAAKGDETAMDDIVNITKIPADEARVIVQKGVPEIQEAELTA